MEKRQTTKHISGKEVCFLVSKGFQIREVGFLSPIKIQRNPLHNVLEEAEL
jgi:hypothetical protein